MAGRIPPHFIDDLMARVDIVEVIDERVPLKKAGRDFMACCPFHDEKTPSFSVSREKQFYHCFGCRANGSAIGFLMEFAGMNFVEAVEELAERAGVEVPREGGSSAPSGPDRRPVFAILERAANFYERQLREHEGAGRAVEYLKDRGLDGETAAAFDMGYAPPGWDNLGKALAVNDESLRALRRAGLVVDKEGGQGYDRLRDRIVFPIHDTRGRIVGFGGRVLDDSDTPKYLNSPETEVFHKGSELYGLYQARQKRRNLERLIVVEGYMDVVALAQHGIDNAVATLGTSATRDHLDRLFRTAPEVVFCFDGDGAGRRAAWRALETALPLLRDGRQAAFAFLPDGEDPDSQVRSLGAATFQQNMARATSLTDFLFEHLLEQVNTTSMDGRARLVDLAKPLLTRLPAGPLQTLAGHRLAELSGLTPAEVARVLGGKPLPARPRVARKTSSRSAPSLVRRAITLLIHHPQLAAAVPDAQPLRSVDRPGAPLLAEVIEILHRSPDLTMAGLLERFRDHDSGAHLRRLAEEEPPVLVDGLTQELADAIAKLAQAAEGERWRELSRTARERPLDGDELQEFNALLKRGAGSRDVAHVD